MEESGRHPLRITTPIQARWRHVVSITVQAFIAALAATSMMTLAVVMLLFRTEVAVLIAMFGCLALSAVLAALAGFGAYRIHLEDERRAYGQCLRCGYDLRESGSRCPECGTKFIHRRRPRAARTEGSASSARPS